MKKTIYRIIIISVFLFLLNLIVTINNSYGITIYVYMGSSSGNAKKVDNIETGFFAPVGQECTIMIEVRYYKENTTIVHLDYNRVGYTEQGGGNAVKFLEGTGPAYATTSEEKQADGKIVVIKKIPIKLKASQKGVSSFYLEAKNDYEHKKIDIPIQVKSLEELAKEQLVKEYKELAGRNLLNITDSGFQSKDAKVKAAMECQYTNVTVSNYNSGKQHEILEIVEDTGWKDILEKTGFPGQVFYKKIRAKTKEESTGRTYMQEFDFAYIQNEKHLMYTYKSITLTDNSGNTVNTDKNANKELDNYTNSTQEAINNVQNSQELTNKLYITINKNPGTNRTEGTFNDIFSDVNYYIPSSEDVPSEFTDKASVILTVITNIGMVIAVLMSAILGIKYMLASVEEKADYKKGMIPYLVGAFLLFGICTIVKIMQQFGESINNI